MSVAPAHYPLVEQMKQRLSAERGTIFKDAPLKIALCYPSPYHVGMSSLGFQTIYRHVNLHEGASAERAFLPDDLEAYRRSRAPLLSYESTTPISAFHAIAFSVAFELELTGLFAMLELAGLPVLREQRSEDHPLVVCGGPLTFSNPTPLEPFADLIVQGEADDLVHELLNELSGASTKAELLAALAQREGFYVPGQTSPSRRFFVARAEDQRLPARSQVVTPNTELRSMFLIEPERGCSRGCHYCVMRRTTNGGMRTVAPDRVLALLPEWAERVGLVGAAVTDHPRLLELLETIVASGREVGVSSLRADRLNQPLVNALRAGGAKVLTVAADGASQRLRDLIDRKHSEDQLLSAARLGRAAGMERLKLYCILGLPTEEDFDIDELAGLVTQLSRVLPVSLGVSPFVAKRNTPMDGAPFAGIKQVEARLARLRGKLRGRAEVRPTSARWAWVEHMLAQCGPEAGLAALTAYRAGCAFSAWKRAFGALEVKPFLARRTADGRRRATEWPSA